MDTLACLSKTNSFADWRCLKFDLCWPGQHVGTASFAIPCCLILTFLTFDPWTVGRRERSPWRLLHVWPRPTCWHRLFCHLTLLKFDLYLTLWSQMTLDIFFVYNLNREKRLREPYAWITWQYHFNCRSSDFAKLTFLTLVTSMWHLRGQRSCHKCRHDHWSLWQSFIKIGLFVY